jgi:2-(1,2-epoxy-1,2-dihydrophenyl)acetyl-CoA isomerase
MTEAIEVSQKNDIALVIFNRPDRFNAFDLDTISNLADHLLDLAANPNVLGVVISGNGKAFCSGGDVQWMSDHPDGIAAALHLLAGRFHHAVLEIRRMAKPVFAAINGIAAGGGFSLALACDFRIMAKSSTLWCVYPSRGLCIDGSGTFTLPRIVGLAKALEIAAFDNPISSEQAREWGLVTRVVDDGHTKDVALEMAQELAKQSLHTFGLSKQLLTDSFDNTFERQLEWERAGLCRAGAHPHGIEGIQSFVEKRNPVFRNK